MAECRGSASTVVGSRAQRLALAIALLLAAVCGSIPAQAQPPPRINRIALIDYGAPDSGRQSWWEAFRDEMRTLGYQDGRNIAFETVWGHGDSDRLTKLVADVVGRKGDVMVVASSNSAIAAKRATTTIPIVMATGSDPVGLGIVASLRRPGGNVTGLTSVSSDLTAKRLELLRTVMPRSGPVAFFWDERNPASRLAAQEAEAAAKVLEIPLKSVKVGASTDFEAVMATLDKEHVAGLGIATTASLRPLRDRLAGLALKHHLASVGGDREWSEAGLLLSYGVDYPTLFRRAATLVDKILNGAKPGDLPIEQPTKFDLSVNLKTAKALGLKVPPSLLQRADRVIE